MQRKTSEAEAMGAKRGSGLALIGMHRDGRARNCCAWAKRSVDRLSNAGAQRRLAQHEHGIEQRGYGFAWRSGAMAWQGAAMISGATAKKGFEWQRIC